MTPADHEIALLRDRVGAYAERVRELEERVRELAAQHERDAAKLNELRAKLGETTGLLEWSASHGAYYDDELEED